MRLTRRLIIIASVTSDTPYSMETLNEPLQDTAKSNERKGRHRKTSKPPVIHRFQRMKACLMRSGYPRTMLFILLFVAVFVVVMESSSGWLLIPPPSPILYRLRKDRLVQGMLLGYLASNRPRIGIFPRQAVQQGVFPLGNPLGNPCPLQQSPLLEAPFII